jgi:hydroxyacylglutathione hydrolase
MQVTQIAVGAMANVSYLIMDESTGHAVLVDPAFDAERLVAEVRAAHANLTGLVLTHHHDDHINAAVAVKARTGATIFASPRTRDLVRGSVVVDRTVDDGEGIPCGNEVLRVFHTPGHAPGSICLDVAGRWLITGDTLFIGDCGRADLDGGDPAVLFASLQRLKRLDDRLIVCPGHQYGPVPQRSLGEEKRLNPALVAETLEAFRRLP